jgi:hypothetical protein
MLTEFFVEIPVCGKAACLPVAQGTEGANQCGRQGHTTGLPAATLLRLNDMADLRVSARQEEEPACRQQTAPFLRRSFNKFELIMPFGSNWLGQGET